MAGYFAQFAADFQRQSLNNLALANQKTQQLVRRPADWRKEPGTDEKERREREKERETHEKQQFSQYICGARKEEKWDQFSALEWI